VMLASATVKAGGKGIARAADMVKTCNDPADMPTGAIIAAGTVMVG